MEKKLKAMNRLPIDLIVEIGILAGPDEYEQIAKTSKRNAIILQKPYIIKATNAFIIESCGLLGSNECYRMFKYNGCAHSFNDQPALIHKDGTQKWFQHGNLHRDNDLPAVIHKDGTQKWFQHGNLHRDNDLPVFILTDGSQYWYQHGNLHRDNNQPAIT
jgi:hypothetical protein